MGEIHENETCASSQLVKYQESVFLINAAHLFVCLCLHMYIYYKYL